MARYQVTCVTTRDNTHEGITFLAGPNFQGTKQQVINSINNGNVFYVIDRYNSRESIVEIVKDSVRGDYLRTSADGFYNNNLLSLPSC
ncbi:MAG: DUF3892 domain-containing protein [Chloroflexi bacterium]|nr:DUF3892 domain-containing protein [Chloroflexota bacterium]